MKAPITVGSWDESICTCINRGTRLTFSLPPHLPYRQLFFYVEADVINNFFLTGLVVLTYKGAIVATLPASIGSGQIVGMLRKSILTAFPNQVGDRKSGPPDSGLGVVGQAVPGSIHLCTSGEFVVTAYNNLIALAPRNILAEADRFDYVVEDWSRGDPAGVSTVTQIRAFGFVLSSSHPL